MILLVEDDSGIREALCAFLRMRGHEVRGASSLQEGLELLSTEHPRAIITDVDLGDGDGRTLVDQARRVADSLPVLLSSAREPAALEPWLCRQKGVLALRKPIRPMRLLQWLESLPTVAAQDVPGIEGLSLLSSEDRSLSDRVLSLCCGRASRPPVVQAWREGERIRLRISRSSADIRMCDLPETHRHELMEMDLDLWPGGTGITELGFLVREKVEELAGFPSTPEGLALEKNHEGGAWDQRAQSGRVDPERRALWPDASPTEVDAPSEAVIQR